MRVLIIVGSEKVPTFIATLVRGLAATGIHVGLYGKNLKATQWKSIHLIASDFHHLAFLKICWQIVIAAIQNLSLVLSARNYVDDSPFWKVRIKNFYRIIKILQFKPDVIHIQWALHSKGFEKLIRSSRCNVVLSLRGTQINVTPFADKEIDALYQRIFPFVCFHSVSQDLKQKSLRWHHHPERVKVIYSPVPDRFISAFDSQKTVEAKPLRILSIGRFHWIKGYTYAIEAIKILADQGIHVQYTIVAQGEIPGEVLYQIHDRKLDSCIEIINGVAYAEIISVLQQHTVLLLPSVEEGIANVVLEAMAVGLPVITTNCGGMAEVVTHDVNGWLVPLRNAQAIAEALKTYSLLPVDKIALVRAAAHDKIRTTFSQKNLTEFKALYEWVAAQP